MLYAGIARLLAYVGLRDSASCRKPTRHAESKRHSNKGRVVEVGRNESHHGRARPERYDFLHEVSAHQVASSEELFVRRVVDCLLYLSKGGCTTDLVDGVDIEAHGFVHDRLTAVTLIWVCQGSDQVPDGALPGATFLGPQGSRLACCVVIDPLLGLCVD